MSNTLMNLTSQPSVTTSSIRRPVARPSSKLQLLLEPLTSSPPRQTCRLPRSWLVKPYNLEALALSLCSSLMCSVTRSVLVAKTSCRSYLNTLMANLLTLQTSQLLMGVLVESKWRLTDNQIFPRALSRFASSSVLKSGNRLSPRKAFAQPQLSNLSISPMN